MKTYDVQITAEYIQHWHVEAESREQARQIVDNGDGILVSENCVGMSRPKEIWCVRRADQDGNEVEVDR